MKIQDPHSMRLPGSEREILMLGKTVMGNGDIEETYAQFQSESAVIVRAKGNIDKQTVAKFLADTTLWSYDNQRRLVYYQEDRSLLLPKIIKTVNLALFKNTSRLEIPAQAEMITVIVGAKGLWIGSMGNMRAIFIRSGIEKQLIPSTNNNLSSEQYLGISKHGYVADYNSFHYKIGDSVCLLNTQLESIISNEDIRKILTVTEDSLEGIEQALDKITAAIREKQKSQPISICIIKCIENLKITPFAT